MRAAKILERARTGTASLSSGAFAVGVVVAAVVLVALWWLKPEISVSAGLLLLIAAASQIGVLVRRVRHLADLDSLTGSASRPRFAAALQRAVEDCRHYGTPASLAVLDCDDFKKINGRFGHIVGDAVLIAVADVLLELVKAPGLVGRLWGDAFCVLLPGVPLEAAHRLLAEGDERLRAQMASRGWPMTFSIGISSLRETMSSPEELLSEADSLMFSVKHRGRNGIACHAPSEAKKVAITRLPSEIDAVHNGLASPVCSPSTDLARQP
jgi:diguanylate cyclase (GGDEF)-like protein